MCTSNIALPSRINRVQLVLTSLPGSGPENGSKCGSEKCLLMDEFSAGSITVRLNDLLLEQIRHLGSRRERAVNPSCHLFLDLGFLSSLPSLSQLPAPPVGLPSLLAALSVLHQRCQVFRGLPVRCR